MQLFPGFEKRITPGMSRAERVALLAERFADRSPYKESIFDPEDCGRLPRYSTAWDYVEDMVASREFSEDEFPDLDNEPSE